MWKTNNYFKDSNEEKENWHYLAVNIYFIEKNIKTRWWFLLFESSSYFYEKVFKKDFCVIIMPFQKDNILQFNQFMKSDKMPYITHADIKFFIKKINGCANNPEKSWTTKKGEHIPYRYSMSTISAYII